MLKGLASDRSLARRGAGIWRRVGIFRDRTSTGRD
jgi:hypothetical protein